MLRPKGLEMEGVPYRAEIEQNLVKSNTDSTDMTQEERWNIRYQEVMAFIESNHRNPSRHRIEEHDMLNWVKQQRKLKNKGELKTERAEMLERLLSLWEEYKRKNQYE